jgi:hypothetical protein
LIFALAAVLAQATPARPATLKRCRVTADLSDGRYAPAVQHLRESGLSCRNARRVARRVADLANSAGQDLERQHLRLELDGRTWNLRFALRHNSYADPYYHVVARSDRRVVTMDLTS